MKLKAFNQRDFTSSFSMEANLEKSSSQNRGITPSSSPKPIILNNNDVFFKKQKKNENEKSRGEECQWSVKCNKVNTHVYDFPEPVWP